MNESISERIHVYTKCLHCGFDFFRIRSYRNVHRVYVSTVYCDNGGCSNLERATSIVSQDYAERKALMLFASRNVPDCYRCGSTDVQVIHNATSHTFDCVIKCHTCGRIVAGLSAASEDAACRTALKNWKEGER